MNYSIFAEYVKNVGETETLKPDRLYEFAGCKT